MNQTTINVPTTTTNKRSHKKVQNVSETLRKLKKMQTGNLTISKTVVQGPKPIRKCKTEPKTYKEEGEEDSEAEFERVDDEDNDPNFDSGAHEVSESDDNDNGDDDDDDYRPPGSKKARINKSTQKINGPNQKLSQFNAKDPDNPSNQKFKSIKINAPPVFLCMKCKNRFESLLELKQHVFQKNTCTISQLTCNVCEKTFDNKKRMSQHMKIHEEKVKYICDKCGQMFKTNFCLENHKSAKHGEYLEEHQNVYKCRLCSEKFDNRTDLYAHMKNHSKDCQEMLCDTCGKSFTQKNLKNHMRTHLDIRPHACALCPKRFRTRLLLKQHLHVHTGIKEFQCNVCSQQFAKQDSLRIHMRKRHADYQPKKEPIKEPIKETEVPINIIEKPSNDNLTHLATDNISDNKQQLE